MTRIRDDALPLSYRDREASNIMPAIRAGDSCSIVGVSGTAKSNLFRHLLNPEVRQHYLGDAWQSYVFLAVDSHALAELSERVVYDMLLECLTAEIREHNVAGDLVATVEQLHQQVLPSADPLDWQRVFARAVRAVMTADAERRLIFLFDQFDEVYKALHPRFFANLRAIRDQHKYRISFVTFTRDVLPRISQCPESEEFYELLSPNIIGLGPYDYDDSWGLLHRVAGRYGLAPDHALGDRLTALTGGHPGLLKAAYMATMRDNLTLPETDPEAIQTLLDKADVRTECLKLWDSIGEDEREVLSDIAGGFRLLESERDAFQLLKLKGLVTEGDDNRVSIPCGLLNVFVADFAPAKARDLKLDERSGRVWVEGKAVEELTPLELALLCHLYERPGEVCTRDEIICALYPEELEDLNAEISNSRVDTLIARLREKIEPDHNRPRYIITVRGRGYKLSGVS